MSDDLDRFVLTYTVDLRDSIESLRKLHEKMAGVKKEGKDAAGGVKDFAADATSELGRLVPGLDAVSKAVRGMGAEFTGAALAIGTLAAGVKAVIDLRAQFNAQRQAGMELGVSSTRLENYQRGFLRASGGYVDREKALAGLQRFREMTRAAYTDPSRVGHEALIMRRFFGVNVGTPGSPNTFNSDLTQLATNLQGKSQGEIQGIAQATGFSQDWLMTLQKLGPQIGTITELTKKEIDARAATQKQLDAYNNSLNKLKGEWNQLEVQIGSGLIPAAEKLIGFFTTIAGVMDTMSKHSRDADLPEPAFGVMGDRKPPEPSSGNNWWDRFWDGFWKHGLTPEQRKAADDKKKAEENKKAEQAKLNSDVKTKDQVNEQGQATADQMTLAINQFAAAVGDFAGAAPSVQEMLAAWAGSAGKAAGLPGSSNAALPGTKAASGGARGLRNNNPGNVKYGPFAKSMGASGADSGGFAIFPTMDQGADAARKLIDNYRKSGVDTVDAIVSKYAPSSDGNNHAAYMKFLASKGYQPGQKITNAADAAKLADAMMINESGYRSNPNAIGLDRSKLQRLEVARGLASILGVPEAQLLQGDVSQIAIAAALGGSKGKLENEILKEQTGISTLQGATDPTSKLRLSGLQMKLRSDQMKLQNLNAYGDSFLGKGGNGGYMPPQIQSMTNNFNIHSNDPHEVAKEVEKIMSTMHDDTLANFSTGRKS